MPCAEGVLPPIIGGTRPFSLCPHQAATYSERLDELGAMVEKSEEVFSTYATNSADCDQRAAQLRAENEELQAKIAQYPKKVTSLAARAQSLAKQSADAAERKDALAAEVRALQARRSALLASGQQAGAQLAAAAPGTEPEGAAPAASTEPADIVSPLAGGDYVEVD